MFWRTADLFRPPSPHSICYTPEPIKITPKTQFPIAPFPLSNNYILKVNNTTLFTPEIQPNKCSTVCPTHLLLVGLFFPSALTNWALDRALTVCLIYKSTNHIDDIMRPAVFLSVQNVHKHMVHCLCLNRSLEIVLVRWSKVKELRNILECFEQREGKKYKMCEGKSLRINLKCSLDCDSCFFN